MSTSRKTPDALRERAQQLLAQAKAAETRAAQADRKSITHKKIVLGAFFLSQLQSDGRNIDLSKLDPRTKAALDDFVKRPHDRKAIGLSN